MENIARQLGRQFCWTQENSFVRSFELKMGKFIYAKLNFHSDFHMAATGSTQNGSWSFDRVGFFNPRVEIRQNDTGALTGIYTPKFWGDGLLKLASGQDYFWAPQNFWRTSWGFLSENERQLFTLSLGSEKSSWRDIFKNQAIVEIAPSAVHLPELPLLILAGWYLTNLQQADDTATVAAISASTAV